MDWNNSCSLAQYYVLRLSPSVLYFISICDMILFLSIHVMVRNCFHLQFSIYFGSVILMYVCCDISSITTSILGEVLPPDHLAITIASYTVSVTYSYTYPLFLFLTIERIYATVNAHRYETHNPWLLYILASVFSTAFSVLNVVYGSDAIGEASFDYAIIAFEVLIYSVVLATFVVNRRLTVFHQRNNSPLTFRYQLVENIRACRLILIFVFLDTLIFFSDTVRGLGFQVSRGKMDFDYDSSQCHSTTYMLVWTITRYWGIAVELTIPFILISQHPVYRSRLKRIFRLLQCTCNKTKVEQKFPRPINGKTKLVKIVNALGREVKVENSMDDYFYQLNLQWK